MEEEIVNPQSNIQPARKKNKKGRETVFRVTYQNQINQIKIADNKAHLIITINSIIITAIFTVAGIRKGGFVDLFNNIGSTRYMIPLFLLLITSLLSVTFAIMAARPYVRKPSKNIETTPAVKSSLLFFANISAKSQETYVNEMRKLLKSEKSIRDNMIIDIYNQAKVITRKYNMLSIAYEMFMYGFILGLLSFITVFFIL